MRDEQREHRRILELVRELRRDGFEVETDSCVGPRKLKADIIARKDAQTIVVEVKTSGSLRDEKNTVAELADYVRTLPGHRFDLVLTNPRLPRHPIGIER